MKRGDMSLSGTKMKRSHMLGYGIGSIGSGIFSTVPGMLLLFYMTNALGIPAELAALAVFVPKMWDVVTDPIIGMISDRTRSRWGRRPYLLVGAILTGLFFYGLFNVPLYDSVSARFWHVSLLYVLCATGYTIFAIPYIALPAEMTSDPHERTRIVSYRMVFLFVGIIFAGGLSPVVVEYYGGGVAGYGAMSLLLALIIAASMMASFFGLKDIKLSDSGTATFSVASIVNGPLKNPGYLIIFGAYALQLGGFGCLLAGLPYYTTYVLGGGSDQLSIMFLLLNVSAILSIPLWLRFSYRVGKLKAFKLSGLTLVFSMAILWMFSTPDTVLVVYLMTAIAGVGFAGQQSLGFALLPDLVDFDPSGRAPEDVAGVYTGIWVAGEKTGFALGAFFVGTSFGVAGLVETTEGSVGQTQLVLETIKFCTALAPALLFASGLLLMRLVGKSRLAQLTNPGLAS